MPDKVVTGITLGSLLSTGALVAAGTALIYQLKGIPKLIYAKIKQRLIYTVRVYQYDELFEMLEKWLSVHHKALYRDVEAITKNCNRTPVLLTGDLYDNKLGLSLQYKQEDNTFIIKYLDKKILINKSKEKLEKAQNLKDIWFRKYTLSGIRAKTQIDKLLKEAILLSKKEEEFDIVQIYANNSWGNWEGRGKKRIKPLDKTILNKRKKDSLIEDLNVFVKSENWYKNASIPYKRGYCLYGPPGTGKTTLSLALANYTKRDLYCLNLNSIEDDSRLPNAFSSIEDNSILLIEDIDKVFSGRDNVLESSKITFSTLLNCLDGAFYRHGLIVIITTNHIEKLDEALMRTGRIDLKMRVPLPSEKEISEYLSLFYETPLELSGEFSLKMSDVQEICLKNRKDSSEAIKQILSYGRQYTNTEN